MIKEFVGLAADVEALKNAFGRALKVGPVHAVDADKGYRIRLGGTDEQPFLSPWYSHPETGKTSVPLKVGQVIGIVNPSGDPRQGFIMRSGYSDDHPTPNNDMEANVFKDAGVEVSIADGKLLVKIGGCTWTLSGGGFHQEGGTHSHNDKDTGASHTHSGIVVGTANTLEPNGL